MENKMKRPVSVWIAQILVLVAGLPFAILLLLSILGDVMFLAATGLTLFSVVASFLLFVAKIAFISLFFFAFLGLAKRKNYGRWLSVITISLLIVMSVIGQFIQTSGPLEYYEYENSAQRFGGIIARIMIYGLFGLLIFRLGFGANTKEFFQRSPHADIAEPPPPPLFTNM